MAEREQIIDKIISELFQADLLNEADYSSAMEVQEECKDIIKRGLAGYYILKGDIY